MPLIISGVATSWLEELGVGVPFSLEVAFEANFSYQERMMELVAPEVILTRSLPAACQNQRQQHYQQRNPAGFHKILKQRYFHLHNLF